MATLPRAPYRQLQVGERFARIGDKTGVYEVEGFKMVEDLSLGELELLGKTKYTGLCAVATFLERTDWPGSSFYGRGHLPPCRPGLQEATKKAESCSGGGW